MDTSTSKPSRKNWIVWLLAPVALLLAGCDVKVVDLTPSSLKANPSNVYSITAQITVTNSAVMEQTVQPEVVIDGKVHPMVQVPGSTSLYEYDYRMPLDRNKAAYYLLVRFDRKTANGTTNKEVVTGLTQFEVENRYAVELETNRAPVGARVAILGRGFTQEDKVIVGGSPASTRADSSTSLSFYVPNLPEGRNYDVQIQGAKGEMFVGNIRIDESQIRVRPSSISLSQGQKSPLVFTIPQEAPPGGMNIRVTTDIPRSVIMGRVKIEGGQRSTSIDIQGGEPGSGSLFVEVPGFSEVVVPISVN